MKYRIIIVFLLLLLPFTVLAQLGDSITHRYRRTQTMYLLSAGPSVAIGEFSTTHLAGAGIEASGITLFPNRKKTVRTHPLLLSWGISSNYYFGRNRTIAGYDYTYPGYWLSHVKAGAIWKVKNNLLLSLTGGPGISVYNGTTRFNAAAQVAVYYAITQRYFISPVFKLMQEPGTDWLGALGLRFTMRIRGKD
ncbi:MAG: hypothetical protein NTW29_02990 [Bacteroidetes bacterium]|nr:hypothetical protein [Bacteroidota bacterium]